MKKIDFKRELRPLYNPSPQNVSIVQVPEMQFLMIDGKGDPNKSESFQEAVNALYSVSYTLKFMYKKGEKQIDYGVMPLEGLWWTDDMAKFSTDKKDDWKWTLMIMQPSFIQVDEMEEAKNKAKDKKGIKVIDQLRFKKSNEGKSIQIMHIGPFSEEGPTIEKLHNYCKENSLEFNGKHHEIYLSDIRKAAPEKWKTIIRQPIK